MDLGKNLTARDYHHRHARNAMEKPLVIQPIRFGKIRSTAMGAFHNLPAVHATGSEPTPPCFAGAQGLRGWLRLPWDIVVMPLGLLYWLVFGGLLTLVGGPLHVLLPRRSGLRLGRFLLRNLFRMFVVYLRLARLVRVDSTALAKLEASPDACIVAPNHTSLWDVVFLVARMPRAVCVMKESILKNPVLGGGARLAGYIANDSRTRVIRNAAEALAAGGQLLLFPEGTRTRRHARWINPLTGGCAIIAMRSGAPVLPVFIRSDSRYLEKGWPLWKRPSFPIHMRIEAGQPMMPLPGESAQEFTRRLEKVFETELAKTDPLRRWCPPRDS
jgi:1-acyl-sn-glycerol-3-phosphate acyltransferase